MRVLQCAAVQVPACVRVGIGGAVNVLLPMRSCVLRHAHIAQHTHTHIATAALVLRLERACGSRSLSMQMSWYLSSVHATQRPASMHS
eukprot:3967115-Pleurochrysis_carterae.AAC.1